MSANRYVAILPGNRDDEGYWTARISELGLPALELLLQAPDLIVLGRAQHLWIRDGEAGLVLGEMFRDSAAVPCDDLDATEQHEIAAGGPDHLVRRYWGAYVAIFRNPNASVSVFRAPFGDLPVYIWRSRRGLLIASDIDLICTVGSYAPAVDPVGLSEHLVAADLRRSRTCLAGIDELSGGSEGRWRNGTWEIFERWTPWSAVPDRSFNVGPDEAGEQLGPVIRRAVAARIARRERPLILLSGGLDSSIVAASVAAAGHSAQALTMVTHDVGGDERRYAAATAATCGIPLHAVERDVGCVDISRSLADGTPRPGEKSFAQATHAAVQSAARQGGLNCVVHGGGGDNIFCSLQSAAPVADRLLACGPDRRFWAVAAQIAALAQVSLVQVVEKAFLRALDRRRPYRFPADHSLLTPHAVALASGALDHSWLWARSGALPGTAAHIGLIAAAQSIVESPDPRRSLPWIAPLISQPVIEACMLIPSWAWYDRGCNRAAARHAFSHLLPAEIAWRRSKGAMDSFIVEIFEANRSQLAALLLDGELTARGLVDRGALAAALTSGGPTRGQTYARVMQLADAEAWVSSWAR
jgi:asparagine synthase (glutamine-hydrolysing)